MKEYDASLRDDLQDTATITIADLWWNNAVTRIKAPGSEIVTADMVRARFGPTAAFAFSAAQGAMRMYFDEVKKNLNSNQEVNL